MDFALPQTPTRLKEHTGDIIKLWPAPGVATLSAGPDVPSESQRVLNLRTLGANVLGSYAIRFYSKGDVKSQSLARPQTWVEHQFIPLNKVKLNRTEKRAEL